MAGRSRVAVQIVAAGLGALAAMASLWFVSGAYLIAEQNHAAAVRAVANEIERSVQQARRWEKEFLLSDVRAAAFHAAAANGTTPSTRSLSEHQQTTASLERNVAALEALLDDPALISQLSKRAREYEQSFQAVVDAYVERGFQDWGLVGRWREAAHQIESAAQQNGDAGLQIDLLALRRNEKDFLLRGAEYEQPVYEQIERLRQVINTSGAAPDLHAAVDRYDDAFRSYVETDTRIGSTDEDGLRADMRVAAQAIEDAATTLAAKAKTTETRTRRYLILASVVIGLFGVAFAAALILWRARTITRPLIELRETARRFGRGELNSRVQIDERNEVGDLGDAFNTMAADLERSEAELEQKNATLAEQLEQLTGLCRMLEDQAKVIESDLERAAVIQHALLPQSPPRLDGWSLQTLYRPGTQVGGDFYDVVHLGVRHFGVLIADAAGHGVAAAMLSVLFKQSVQLRDTNGVRSPAQVLASANKRLCADVSAPGVFVTAAYALVDRRDGSVQVASAGHPPCLHLAADGTTQKLPRTGPALGLSSEARYDETRIDMSASDRLLLYTDGILNEESPDVLAARVSANTKPAVSLRDIYAEAIKHPEPDRDDITLVMIARDDATSHYDHDVSEDSYAEDAPIRETPLLTNGIIDDHAFMQITGKATWLRAAIFYATANQLLEQHSGLTIDLRDCAYLDSTFLGTIHELVVSHVDQVHLQHVPDSIIDLFEELSMQAVIKRIDVNIAPLPARMEPLARTVDEEEQRKRLIKAHEVLATLSDENERQFRSVVDNLRAEWDRTN